MTMAATNSQGSDLRTFLDGILQGPVKFDFFGLVLGFKVYQVYTALAAKSDAELDRLGVARTELARVAMDAVRAA